MRFGVYDNLEFEFPVEDKDLTDDSWILIAQTLYLDKSDNPVNWCAVEENIYTGLVTDKSLINTIKSKLYLMNRKGELAENIYRTEEVDLKAKSCNVDVTKEGNYYIDYTFKDPSTFQQKEKRRNVVVKNTSSNEGNDGEGNENGDEIIATFDPNGGSVVTNKKIRKLNQSYGELPLSTKDNYNFTGWYTESSGGELIMADTKITNTEDHTLYAHWTSNLNVDSTLNHLNISCNKTESPSFSNKSGMLNDGPYGLVDDYGISCYFRGGSINNYVKFGKNKDGADMYWRIIRVNGDGSLRMIYDGTSAHANKENDLDRFANTKTVWNSNNDDAKYVGYMYGEANGKASTSTGEAQTNETDSIIKIRLENW